MKTSTKSSSNRKAKVDQFLANEVKRADQNGGVSVASLNQFTSDEIADLMTGFMSQPGAIFWFGSSMDDD